MASASLLIPFLLVLLHASRPLYRRGDAPGVSAYFSPLDSVIPRIRCLWKIKDTMRTGAAPTTPRAMIDPRSCAFDHCSLREARPGVIVNISRSETETRGQR